MTFFFYFFRIWMVFSVNSRLPECISNTPLSLAFRRKDVNCSIVNVFISSYSNSAGSSVCRICSDKSLRLCQFHCRDDIPVDVPHRFGAQTFGLMFALDSINPPTSQQLLVEILQLQRSRFFQRNFADTRFNMVVDASLVSLAGGRSYFYLCVVFEPLVHSAPTVCFSDSVTSMLLIFSMAGFAVGRCLCPGAAQDVFVNRLSGFQIVPCSVVPFPVAIFLFLMLPSPLAHFFTMLHASRSATQHTTWKRKSQGLQTLLSENQGSHTFFSA